MVSSGGSRVFMETQKLRNVKELGSSCELSNIIASSLGSMLETLTKLCLILIRRVGRPCPKAKCPVLRRRWKIVVYMTWGSWEFLLPGGTTVALANITSKKD
jgi:hypothetical protein